MIKHVDIYMKKQSVEYAGIVLDVSCAIHSIRSLYSLLISYRDKSIHNTVNNLRLRVLQK